MKVKKINIYDKTPSDSVSNAYKTSDLSLEAPCVHMINGCRNTGKGYLMSKILAQAKRDNVYDKIYMITPSFQSNKAYFGKYVDEEDVFPPSRDAIDRVVEAVEQDRDEFEKYLEDMEVYQHLLEIIHTLDDEELLRLYEEGLISISGKPERPVWKYKVVRPPQSALILDDCITSDAMLKSTNKHTITSIGVYNRHLASLKKPHSDRSSCGLSLYFMVQSYSCQNGTPRLLREQLTHLTTFKNKQPKQYDKMREEACNIVEPEEFDIAYQYATKDKYGNLTITFNPRRPELTYRKNLNELIIF
tara:strand:+ start:288 stop:1196 length:909 start_codon:yes stop_codon:yes gene_type:complete